MKNPFYALVLATSLLVACDQKDKISDVNRAEESIFSANDEEEINTVNLYDITWLHVHNSLEPAVWLSSIDLMTNTPSAQNITIYSKLLDEASDHFEEGPRMIANRTVQLKSMMLEMQEDRTLRNILSSLIETRGGGQQKVNYSALCSQYFNLRKSGNTEAAALAAIKDLSKF